MLVPHYRTLLTVGFALIASATSSVVAIGCSAPDVGTGSGEIVRDRSAGNDDDKKQNTASDAGAASPTSSSSSGGASTPTKTKGDAAAPPPSTPDCLADCATNLNAKCAQEGETDFCEFACETLSPEQRTCLAGTTTCSKDEWIACTAQTGDGDADGDKKK